MIEVVSGKGAAMFTSFWNDGQEDDAFDAAERRARERNVVVRVEKDGKELGAIWPCGFNHEAWQRNLDGANEGKWPKSVSGVLAEGHIRDCPLEG